ncbi:hypothetical protein ACROYT_G032374 [Oculina patagonica]
MAERSAESVSSVTSAGSTSLVGDESSSNASVNHLVNSPVESESGESGEEENSESESQLEEISSEDDVHNQETDLCDVLAALRARDNIHDILSQPIPSATQIVNHAETISGVLHQDCVREEPQTRAGTPSNLVNLMTNITQQIEDYQPGSDVGPALHAARQVAYWSSVFISMVSSGDTTNPCDSNRATPLNSTLTVSSSSLTSLPPSSSQPSSTLSLPTTSFMPSTSGQAPFTMHTTPFAPSPSSQSSLRLPTTSFMPSTSIQAPFPVHTTPFAPSSSSQSSLPLPTTSFVPSTSIQAPFPVPTTFFAPSSSSQSSLCRATPLNSTPTVSSSSSLSSLPPLSSQPSSTLYLPTTSFVLSTSGQAPFPMHTTPFVPSSSSQSSLHLPTTSFVPSTSIQAPFPMHTTPFAPSSSSQSSLRLPTTPFMPSTTIQAPFPVHTTPFAPSSSSQSSLRLPTTPFMPSTTIQAPFPVHTTPFAPSLSSQSSLPLPTTSFVPSTSGQHTSNQPTVSTSTTDPATIQMFMEYGSGSLPDWLDSLFIPRNIDNLQQVKDLWEANPGKSYKWYGSPHCFDRSTKACLTRVTASLQ